MIRPILKLLPFLCLCISQIAVAQGLKTDSLRLFVVGDVMGHGGQIDAAKIVANQQYDYSPCFTFLEPIIQKADLAIANLEVTLPGKPPYQGYPQFRSHDDLAMALRSAGFNMLVTANNHSNDAGRDGVEHTIDVLRQLGFYQTGTFKSQEERDLLYPLLVYKNNFKIAFLNYTYDTNGLSTKAPNVVNLIDPALIKKDLAEAKTLQPDYIIVLMHWGLEYQLKESKVQSDLAKNILAWGGDMVIGSHPHVVQPIKTENVTTVEGAEKSGLVVYSLGNFISGQTKLHTNGGLGVEIVLKKQGKAVEVAQCQYLPIFRYRETTAQGKTNYRALPIPLFEDKTKAPLPLSNAAHEEMMQYKRHVESQMTGAPALPMTTWPVLNSTQK